MTNEELILQKLTDIQQDISEIKEVQAEHTDALNTLIEWAEDVAVVVRVPIAKPIG